MSTPKIKAVLFKSKSYKDGSHPIMIRITQNRKFIYKSVGHAVVADTWDEDTQRVYEKQPKITKRQEGQLNPNKLIEIKEKYKHAIVLHNANAINADIEDKLNEVSGISQKLKVNDKTVDLKTIKSKLNPQLLADRNISFLTFGREFRDRHLKEGAIGTHKRYKTILTKLDEYLNNKDLLFADVTIQFLRDYEAHLISLDNKVNTVNNNLKSIRAIYYAAMREQIITTEKNPFIVFRLKADNKVKKDKLSVDEIVAIENLELAENSFIENVRNFFLFSFYCAGIRVRDVIQLKWENVSAEGRLEYRMEKTGHNKSISLIPKATAILGKYRTKGKQQEEYIFPFLDTTIDLANSMTMFNQISSCTAIINKYLKEIAKKAKIEKSISTHIARHSFSDIARKRKASIYDISKMLGHSSIKITEAYLASFDIDSQDEAMKSILDF